MNMTPFWQPSFYTPLNSKTGELRLLSIRKPENQTVLIKCDTQTFELSHAPRFDALSYVWGDPSVTKEIQFCGLSRLVTENLFEALTRLREEGDSKWIWIDALCINQDDKTEKNHQVPLMRQIYRSADRVFSWLGQADKDTHLAFSLVERWADAILSTCPKLETWPDSKAMRDAAMSIERPFDEQEWAAFITLTKKPYWERLWILQEVTLARRCILLCGSHELMFEKLMWAYRAWMTGNLRLVRLAGLVRPAGEGTQFYSFMNVPLEEGEFVKVKAQPSARRELLEFPFLLKRASILSATDPKDKVYGVLGLLNLASAKIPVDYNSDVVSAYRDTLLTLVKETGRLDLLSFAGTWGKTTQNITTQAWPSWVPDFACTQKRDIDDRFCESSPFYDTIFFHTSKGSVAQCSIDATDPRLLHVRGILLDEISAVVQPFPRPHAEERLRSWLSFTVQHAAKIKPRSISPLQILFRTMIADHLWRGVESPDFLASHLGVGFFRFAAGFLVAIREILEGKRLPDFDEIKTAPSNFHSQLDPELRQRLTAWLYNHVQQDREDRSQRRRVRVRNFLNQPHLHWPDSIDVNSSLDDHIHLAEFRQVFSRTAPRCLFVTSTGYLGAGPGTARTGDKVFLPQGCSVPLVIRPSGNKFEVVADAFVCGVMQGEMFLGKDDGLLNLQDIVLR